MKRLRLLVVALALAGVTAAHAQTTSGQYPSGWIYGNVGASSAAPRAIAPSSWLDRWAGSTSGFVICRDGSSWAGKTPTNCGVQPYDADLTIWAGLTPSANAQSLVTAADYSAMRALLGLVIGTNVQAFDADLSALAANSTDGFWAHTGAGTGAARTLTAPVAGITITNPAGIAGNPTFALTDDLAAVEELSGTGCAARTGASTWATRTITGTTNEITVTNGDCSGGNPALSLPSALTFSGKTVTGGSYAAVSAFGLRDTGASFDLSFIATGTGASANRSITWDTLNGSRTVTLGGNVNFGGSFTTSGTSSFTGTVTGATNVTFPTTGTLQTASILTAHAGYTAVIAQATTIYMAPHGHEATETVAATPLPTAVVLSNMYCRSSSVGGSGQTVTFTLQKNGADQSLTASIGSGSTTTNDTTHTVTYAAGDTFSVKTVTSATTGNITSMSCSFKVSA